MARPACRSPVLAYTIDSNGRVFDVDVVDAWPNEAAAADFVAMHRRWRYEATPANAERVPVRTVSTHTVFKLGSGGAAAVGFMNNAG